MTLKMEQGHSYAIPSTSYHVHTKVSWTDGWTDRQTDAAGGINMPPGEGGDIINNVVTNIEQHTLYFWPDIGYRRSPT